MKKILFTGGGSAGHVVPNIALIEQLLSEGEIDVCYMGTDGIEKEIVAKCKLPYYTIDCPKLIRGGGARAFKQNLKIPFSFFRAVRQAKIGLKQLRPDAVFSKGGYVALPVVVAAKKLKIPCYAHESDFSAGLANALSSRYCKKIFTSFPETAQKLKHGVYSGAPIKRSVFTASRAETRIRLGIGLDETVILVFGGGSGSKTINDAVRNNVKTLCQKYAIYHVCGKGNLVNSTVKNYHQTEFVADMGGLYACADLIVCRAGAGTIFEILALKKPSILIPLEGQTRGDQIENANYFKKRGLCRVLKQSDISLLPQEIENALDDARLKTRLAESDYRPANDFILKQLKKALL